MKNTKSYQEAIEQGFDAEFEHESAQEIARLKREGRWTVTTGIVPDPWSVNVSFAEEERPF